MIARASMASYCVCVPTNLTKTILDPVRVVDGLDQPVLVAGDIEDHAPVLQDVLGTEVGLDVRQSLTLALE